MSVHGDPGTIDAPVAQQPPAGVVVLLEGASDRAAVQVLMATAGIDPRGVELVNLGGVTNVRKALLAMQTRAPRPTVLGLCDAGEAHVARRALGLPTPGPDQLEDSRDLEESGFFVCQADLEDELIRALGPATMVDVVTDLGLGGKLATLQQQRAWQDRPLAEQLHRFCGIASGRKIWLAGELTKALPATRVPPPLAALVERIAASTG